MDNIRLVVKTDKGAFILTPTTQVATIQEKGTKYEFPHELMPNTQIIMRKTTTSEDLTLEDHIIPTLWVRSGQYRQDRATVFEGEGTDLPTKTKLGKLLTEIVVKYGKQLDGPEFIHSLIPPEIKYSKTAVYSWMNNKVMFPERPEALVSVARRLNEPELERWTNEIISLGEAPVKRLRVLHSSIRAAISKPKGHGVGTHKENQRQNQEQNRIISLADYLPFIRAEYGENVFEEFITPAKVMAVEETTIPSSNASGTQQTTSTEMVKDVISFSGNDAIRKAEILRRYPGKQRSSELGEAVREMNDMLINEGSRALIRFHRLLLDRNKHQYPMYKNDKFVTSGLSAMLNIMMVPGIGDSKETMLHYNGEMAALSQIVIFDRNKRRELERLLEKSPAKIIQEGKDVPYLREMIKISERICNYSPIEKSTLSSDEFIPRLINAVKYVGWFFEDREKPNKLVNPYVSDMNVKINSLWDTAKETGIDKLKRNVNEIYENSRMPDSLMLMLHMDVDESSLSKLMNAYGIVNQHGYRDRLKDLISVMLSVQKS